MSQNHFKEIIARTVKKGVFPHQFAFTLLFPIRNIFISPKKLIERLELKQNSIVLEVGPGPGYFSIKIAEYIKDGELTLADIQPEMLNYAKKRIDKKKLKNVKYHLCNNNSFPFPDKIFDVIFMVTVLGEIENQDKYLSEFYRMLKSGGIISISEQAGDPDKLSIEEITELLTAKGFVHYRTYGSKHNFTINFKKE